MKTLSDKDMGVDCDFVAKGDTAEEVMKKFNDHAMKVHPDVVADMSKKMTDEEMKEKMMSKVKDM